MLGAPECMLPGGFLFVSPGVIPGSKACLLVVGFNALRFEIIQVSTDAGLRLMAFWEQVLLGMGAVVLLFLFWPGAKAAMRRSAEAENPDWQGALIPVGLVVLFVIMLIVIARS